MEISLLKALISNISSFLHLSSIDDSRPELVQKCYHKAEEILKLLKPILEAIVESVVVSNETFCKTFDELGQSVDELRDIFETWQPLSSKVYFVLQNESLVSNIRSFSLDILKLLKSLDPDELSQSSIEYYTQKMKQMGYEQTSSIVREAISDQSECIVPSPEILVKIADSLELRSNQDILIEAVALEKLKENAEQDEKTREAELFEQMISLVTHMHDRLVLIKQSQTTSPVPIPADFCCPLSLELMTDPVIVSSGQTYEKAYIKNWIDLGLTVCPKTRQTLAHTNLIPNYTVKALIANWCESNNVKLPDPVKSVTFNQPYHSSRNQPMSPESTRSTGSPLHPPTGSPLHPRSTSEGSLPGIVVNDQSLDMTTLSMTSSEEKSGNLEERNTDLTEASASSPVIEANESSELSNHLTSYSSDNSGEVKGEPLISSHREPEYSPRLIDAWSRNQTIRRRPSDRLVPRIVSSTPIETRADLSGVETQVRKLVEDLNSDSLDTQRTTTSELRLLAKHNMDNRIVIANSGAIAILVNLLRSADSKIQENAVTALLNLSINDNNKTAIANADAIEPLIHVLETGSSEAKENAAATLFSLSVIEDNKVRIGRSGAIGPLVDLLGNGTPRGKKDAATALFNLSIFHENKARIVQAGAVKHLVELMDPAAGMVDKAVAVLANLATIPDGRTAIGQEGGIPVLVEVVELGSARGKENAAAALLQLCTNSSRFCNTVLQEGAVPPLVALLQSGTPRAKEKAQALLQYFRNQRHGNGRG